jgi:hypothetical protein
MGSQPLKYKVLDEFFHLSDFVELSSLIILVNFFRNLINKKNNMDYDDIDECEILSVE